MSRTQDLRAIFVKRSSSSPYPIASACRAYLNAEFKDPWQEWEVLSRGVLTPILQYLSHLLLSDLVATGERPARLFHRIQSILSRPLGGHYVGFLRETAHLYRDEDLTSAVPELVDFVLRSDVDCTILESGKPLLGLLVEYRNLWAHGKFDNPGALDETVATIRELTAELLDEIAFLERYPLKLEDGTKLMGADAVNALSKDPQPLLVVQAGGVRLRPLLLKLKGRDLVLLEDFDLSGRLVFKGTESFEKFTKKQLKKGDGAKLFEELKALLQKVRAVDAVLELPDWDTFSERSAVVADRVIALYEDMNKYVPAWYVPRPEWHGPDSIFKRFMASDKPLLSLSGVQGTGKSALVSHLAHEAIEMGHAVLFVNAQRFTFADVEWTGNPYPTYFADLLHYSRPFEKEVFKRLLITVPEGKQVVLFIDAINEVDGIQIKWNRFRAMELLLEWIAEIAQPKLKIVLSFRLDAYEDYDYLQPDEVPERISEIAFVDTDHQNPRKPWVVDIEPFDAKQAALLYARLQEQPESGMAPSMTWEEILLGLGDNVEQFTSNPLLFMTFLRSHHQEHMVQTSDREELFQRYADKLTGADEVKRWPLWKKVIGFVKNGNITPKEQFLADVTTRMAEEGAASFLVERLDPRRRRRDRRLLEFIQGGRGAAFEDLNEGGLLGEERIEIVVEAEPVMSRRITFVAELMATAMDGVNTRLERLHAVRSFVLIQFAVSVMAYIILGIGFRTATMKWTPGYAAAGISPEEVRLLLWEFVRPLATVVVPSLLLFLLGASVVMLFLKRPMRVAELGLLPAGYLLLRRQMADTLTVRFGLALIALPALWSLTLLFAVSPEQLSLVALIAPLLATMAALLLASTVPWSQEVFARIDMPQAAPRLVRIAFQRKLDWLAAAAAGPWRRRLEGGAAAVVIAALLMAALLRWLGPTAIVDGGGGGNEAEAFAVLMGRMRATVGGMLGRDLPLALAVLAGALALLTPLASRHQPLQERRLAQRLRDRPFEPPLRHGFLLMLLLGYALIALLSAAAIAVLK